MRRLILLIFTLMMCLSPLFSAQSTAQSEVVPIFAAVRYGYNQIRWLPDSQTLIFQATDREPLFYEYNLETGKLAEFKHSPLIINLTPAQQVLFNAANSKAYPSYNGRYIVYDSKHRVGCSGELGCEDGLALGDLETGQYSMVYKSSESRYTVVWGDTSQVALVIAVGYYGAFAGIHYVTNFSQNVNNLTSAMVTVVDPLIYSYVDISLDGQQVLLRDIEYGTQKGLFLWDASSYEQTQEFQQFVASESPVLLTDQVVAGASFIPDNDEAILAITNEGIIQLNLVTGDYEIINPNMNTEWITWAYFSPDNQHVAVLSSCYLFVLLSTFPVIWKGSRMIIHARFMGSGYLRKQLLRW